MKNQLFSKLKQAYASLGLGDDFLQAQADSLAAMGLVTEENIESVVLSQKAFLESVQKTNDKRVTDAVKKANDTAAAKAAELQKQLDELKKTTTPPPPTPPVADDFQAKFAAAQAPMLDTLKALQEQVKTLQEEKKVFENKQAAAERQEKILAKAKELQIPQYRIDEGFSISDTATDEEIGTYLTKVAGNIKTNSLPTNSHFAMAGNDFKKSDSDALADVLVSKL
jgi:DNA repair exonuclease SbcCD ATPase subunit